MPAVLQSFIRLRGGEAVESMNTFSETAYFVLDSLSALKNRMVDPSQDAEHSSDLNQEALEFQNSRLKLKTNNVSIWDN